MKNNTIFIGDSMYAMTAAYRAGALAMRRQIPWNRCTEYTGQRREEWEQGHCHESAGEHIRFGKDLITANKSGTAFNEDPSVPRDEYGVVKSWYKEQLKTLSPVVH